jgi:hypothetical protein
MVGAYPDVWCANSWSPSATQGSDSRDRLAAWGEAETAVAA